MGTYLARYFAIHYPEEIKALILIDPSPDKLYDEYSEQEYEEFQKIGKDSFSNAPAGEQKEWHNYLENRKYVQEKPLPDRFPVIIVSATEWDFSRYHAAMMNRHPESKHLILEGSHAVHQEEPGRILSIIKGTMGL
jgi:pimeloyl-ACP methyl ester carboxylesterase